MHRSSVFLHTRPADQTSGRLHRSEAGRHTKAGEEKQLVVVIAEPKERSRWTVICLLDCVAVMLACIAMYTISKKKEKSPCTLGGIF
jgi:hypothetical protein